MKTAAYRSGVFGAKLAFASVRGRCALLSLSLSLLIPCAVWGDIYKWTDEKGKINISNLPPPTTAKAKNIEVVLKETKSASIPGQGASSTEQALLARIETLERQLQARQYATPAPPVPPPAPYASYYPPTPPPPPPASSYYGSGYASYPGYYPSYAYPVASSYVVYPSRAYVSRPVFVAPRSGYFRGGGGYSHGGGGYSHGGGGHRGRR